MNVLIIEDGACGARGEELFPATRPFRLRELTSNDKGARLNCDVCGYEHLQIHFRYCENPNTQNRLSTMLFFRTTFITR